MAPNFARMVGRVVTVCLAVIVASSAIAQNQAPERPSGWTDKAPVTSAHWMIAAANPLAVDAGYRILAQGGSAVDAAIAVQLVLGLVEPQSSGLGGGAFLLLHDAKAGKLLAYDGRETAPAAARPDRFMKDGKPLAFYDAVIGGKSVGVPGVVRLLETAHRRHGRLPWGELFVPAIELAESGFAVSAAPEQAPCRRAIPDATACTGLFLHPGRQARGRRNDAPEPCVCTDAAQDRHGRCRCVLRRGDCAGHRRHRELASDESGRSDAC